MSENPLCMDHKVLDIYILTQDDFRAPRPQVTVLIDAYTREIIECEVTTVED